MDTALLKRIETIAVIATVVIALVIQDEDNKKRPWSFWVNSYLVERLKKGRFSTDVRFTTRID